MLLRYTQALMTQMMQTAACNRHHSVEQQLCRWLLLTLDRVASPDLIMTQDLVASMLGVRRESVTEAAGRLQDAGCIRYRRGHIAVLDRRHSKNAFANATPWSRTNSAACSTTCADSAVARAAHSTACARAQRCGRRQPEQEREQREPGHQTRSGPDA